MMMMLMMMLTYEVGPDVAGLAVNAQHRLQTGVEVVERRSMSGLYQLVVSQPFRQAPVRHPSPPADHLVPRPRLHLSPPL